MLQIQKKQHHELKSHNRSGTAQFVVMDPPSTRRKRVVLGEISDNSHSTTAQKRRKTTRAVATRMQEAIEKGKELMKMAQDKKSKDVNAHRSGCRQKTGKRRGQAES
jgi:hypothetical protein